MSLTPEERERKEQEIRNLTCELDSSMSGGIGDYQFVRFVDVIAQSDKFWEVFGHLNFPKTREQITAVAAQREAKRERIRQLQEELDNDK